jgi:hypothetical protein
MNNNNDSNANNGLITRLWGPGAWFSLHSITFGYPINPTTEQKKQYKDYFESVGNVLPCSYCRKSYNEFISSDDTMLTDDVFESRATLTLWLYKLHNRVNAKLGVDYGVTYEDIVKRYEAFRAKCTPQIQGCVMPLDEKQKSYLVADQKHCPIVKLSLAQCFKEYAILRKVEFFPENYAECDTDKWTARNKECADIISSMRKGGISSLEQNGEFKGLPTVQELTLLSKLSTTMSKNELINLTKKLGQNIVIVYKLKKSALE